MSLTFGQIISLFTYTQEGHLERLSAKRKSCSPGKEPFTITGDSNAEKRERGSWSTLMAPQMLRSSSDQLKHAEKGYPWLVHPEL